MPILIHEPVLSQELNSSKNWLHSIRLAPMPTLLVESCHLTHWTNKIHCFQTPLLNSRRPILVTSWKPSTTSDLLLKGRYCYLQVYYLPKQVQLLLMLLKWS